MPRQKIVLAYSGGLDTSVAVPWLRENYDADVITCTIDLGMVDLETIRQRAYAVGASDAVTVDARAALVSEFLWPPCAPAPSTRGSIPWRQRWGVRSSPAAWPKWPGSTTPTRLPTAAPARATTRCVLRWGVSTLAPGVALIAPIREWGMNREDEVEYARQRSLPIAPSNSKYSTDENLWGRSAEAGELENPWMEPPEDAYEWTVNPAVAPDEPAYLELRFEEASP